MTSLLPSELWGQVTQDFDQYDFYNLTLVNKEHNALFTRHLYFHINISTLRQETAFLTPICQAALLRNSVHFRRFSTRSYNPAVLAVVKDLPQVVLTHINLGGSGEMSALAAKHMIAILEKNPYILALRVLNAPFDMGLKSVGDLLKTIGRTQMFLRKLELFEGKMGIAHPADLREFFLTVSEHLDYLSIRVTTDSHILTAEEVVAMRRPLEGVRKNHPYLRTLRLDPLLPEQEWLDTLVQRNGPRPWPLILVPFLEGCSDELRTIDDYEGEMDDSNQRRRPSWIHEYPEVRAALKKVIPIKFKELLFDAHEDEWDFRDMDAAMQVYEVMENDDIPGMEPELCNLIRLDRFMTPFPTTFRNIALAARSGFVQKLCIQDGHLFQSDEILKILRKAIHVMQRIQCWGSLPVLHDHVLDPVPWTCTNLVQLDIQIRSIFRPDITTNYLGEPLQDYDKALYHPDFHEAVKLVHRSIYKRLASLESLQILTMGLKTEQDRLESQKINGRKVYFDPLLQTDCLDFSLEYGLDLLADLRDMRVLSVNHMDHRIGKKELKWMERNWLNLECVRGVMREDPKTPWGRPWAVGDPNPADVGFRLR